MNGKIDRRENVKAEFEGTVLVIRCETDPAKVASGPSASGKTEIYATTGGNISMGNGMILGLNLYRKA